MHTLAVSWLVAIALVIGATPTWAETVNCTPILAVPAVITVPGVYCFTKNLPTSMTAGNAIDGRRLVVFDFSPFV